MITKSMIDAQQHVTREEFEAHSHEPEQWGFPGAGILALVMILATLFMIGHSLYLNGKTDGRQQCFYDLKGYNY